MADSPVIFEAPFEKIMDSIRLGVFDLLHTGVAIVDREGRFGYCNRAFLRMYCLPENIVGRHLADFFLVDKNGHYEDLCTQKMIISLGKSTSQVYGVLFRYPIYDQSMKFCGVAIESIPCNLGHDHLKTLMESMHSLEMKTFAPRVSQRKQKPINTFSGMIGKSPTMNSLRFLGQRFALSDEPVLISGESGTGKELVARALHNASPRARAPFISVNCAALPAELIESELFGYDSGAFTGAKAGGMKGKFEQADCGTIFLDEIGELPLSVQAKLLRVLESGEVQKLGHRGLLHSNFRLVGATNRDLLQMVRMAQFREDLYHRLSVFELTVPPLRERGEDIFLLTRFYLAQYLDEKSKVWLSPEMEKIFLHYSWPGNIRELKNTLIYAVYALGGDQKTLGVQHLPKRFIAAFKNDGAPENASGELEEECDAGLLTELELLKITLEKMRYNKVLTARELGISRSKLYRLLHKYQLQI